MGWCAGGKGHGVLPLRELREHLQEEGAFKIELEK